MADSNLTAEHLRAILSYNPETGVFTHAVKHHRSNLGDVAGSLKPSGYIRISIKHRLYQAHRLAWLYVHGTLPPNDIDHVNGIRSDNRLSNLRPCARFENCQNLSVSKTNTSGLVGARFHKQNQNWVSEIRINKKYIHLGCFKTPEAAHQAYVKAKAELHNFQPTIRK